MHLIVYLIEYIYAALALKYEILSEVDDVTRGSAFPNTWAWVFSGTQTYLDEHGLKNIVKYIYMETPFRVNIDSRRSLRYVF